MEGREYQSALISRNVMVNDKRTSIRLERELWDALEHLALQQDKTIHQLCSEIAHSSPDAMGFTSAVRIFIVKAFLQTTENNRMPLPESELAPA